MSPFRISAVILFVAAIVSVGLALANRQSAATGGRDLSGFYTLAVLLTAVGIGLFAHWRPVAAIFIAALISLGAWLGIGSLLDVPFPWALINLLYATLLIAGAVKLIRCWSRLSE